jgi:hypothetical protein
MPDESGSWSYSAFSADERTWPATLQRLGTGTFECTPPLARHAFDGHGPVRVAAGGRHLAHADGTPFFYLADTAWNGALRSSDADWREYLADRAAKGFSAIQFVLMAPWAGAYTDADGRSAYVGDDALGPTQYEINHDFFTRMDERIQAINDAGLLAVPVLAWAANFGRSGRMNPGVSLPRRFLEQLIEYQVARYRARHVLWILAGDGRYAGLRSLKWKRIGRNVFGGGRGDHALVALHPMGTHWPYRSFHREEWLDVLGYQTSHSDAPDTLRWMLTGPPATAWQHASKPIINFEPCYEGIRNWAAAAPAPITRAEVRRALYASLLNAPTAGVSYGAHGVWSWETSPREPLNHPGTLVAPPWREAMNYPGSYDVQRLAALFTSLDWWRLRPAPQVLREQPGDRDVRRFVSVAATDQGDLAIAYLPAGGAVQLSVHWARDLPTAEWFDPRTADRQPAALSGQTAQAPTDDDWVLLIRRPAG